MKLLIDSSVFVAFFNDTDIFHKQSLGFFEKLLKRKSVDIVLPILVFLEIINVLHKKTSKFDEKRLLQAFNDYEKIDLGFDSAKEIIAIFKKVKLKTSDAIILASAVLYDTTLITWDERFKKEAEKFVVVQNPTTFLK